MKAILNISILQAFMTWRISTGQSPQLWNETTNSVTWHSVQIPNGFDEDSNHGCVRECTADTPSMTCNYTFKVEMYGILSKACFNCPINGSDCLRPSCAYGDGFIRPIITVNRRLPGPSIQVCEGDEIIVDVKNLLLSEATAIHWHGLHQIGTPYMDGVPFLTQCPILMGNTFRYHFVADLPGTHYWHSHAGFQRTDGVFGALVIRAREDLHSKLYDVDDPKHLMILTDWFERVGFDKFINNPRVKNINKPYNILINGMGQYQPITKGNESANTPLFEYTVKAGMRYRIRALSNGIQNCPIEISIDNHTILVISSDAGYIKPIEVDSLIVYGGERWDFVVRANYSEGSYWIRFKGLQDCSPVYKSAFQVAILRYEGSKMLPSDPQDLSYEKFGRKGVQLNVLEEAPGDKENFYTTADVRSAVEYESRKGFISKEELHQKPDYTFWLGLNFYSKPEKIFYHGSVFPFFGIERGNYLHLPQLNNISLRLPNVPPLSQPDQLDQSLLCNESTLTTCSHHFCECSHVLNVELGSVVEIILVDTAIKNRANHPFHLHGHAFAVLGMERLGTSTNFTAVKNLEKKGLLQRNFDNPPIKDTVHVPDGGYTVIKFVASNPGYWLFHCHISLHVEVGMGVVFHIGQREHLPPVPKDFPQCHSYNPEASSSVKSEADMWKTNYHNIRFSPRQDIEEVPKESFQTMEDKPAHEMYSNGVGRAVNLEMFLVILNCVVYAIFCKINLSIFQ